MKHSMIMGAMVLGALSLVAFSPTLDASNAVSAPETSGAKEAPTASPINAMCPIGQEPIVATAGTIDYDGHTIGICCPSCGKEFLAWGKAKRDEFVSLALRSAEPGRKAAARPLPAPAQKLPPREVIPYTLNVCVISGGELDLSRDPVMRTIDGREVRFCCGGCASKFEADKDANFKKMDALIVKDQMRYYPTDRCVVTGEPLFEETKDIATNVVHEGRLVRLCCAGCVKRFTGDPKKYVKALDAMAIKAQTKDYPLETCVVAKSELGSMGKPTEIVVAGRMLRFCCAGCEGKAKSNPLTYLATLDTAWQKKGKFTPAKSVKTETRATKEK